MLFIPLQMVGLVLKAPNIYLNCKKEEENDDENRIKKPLGRHSIKILQFFD